MEIIQNNIFIIPYIDQNMSFWEILLEKYGKYIKEVYFPIQDELIGTGRPKQPEKQLVTFLNSKILPVSMLINPVVLPYATNDLEDRICNKLEFYLKHYLIEEVTLSNVSLGHIIKNRFPNLKLTASTLMEIYNEQQLVMLDDIFDTIVPSNRILRDITALKNLKLEFKGKIRLMVNEACLSSCVFRTQHFYEMSNPEITYPHSLCNDLLKQKPWLRLTGGWVLPQHLYLFEGLYDEIKLAGRVSLQRSEHYIHVLDSYILKKTLFPHQIGGGPASVCYPVEISSEFYNYTLNCMKNCSSCKVCENYWIKNTGKNE